MELVTDAVALALIYVVAFGFCRVQQETFLTTALVRAAEVVPDTSYARCAFPVSTTNSSISTVVTVTIKTLLALTVKSAVAVDAFGLKVTRMIELTLVLIMTDSINLDIP